jgi:20S proteasome subunit alpha 3
MPVEQLVQAICNTKQSYTQHGGMRPYGVSFLYAGWDRIYGWQLYQSDPSGNYSGWKATCIGTNSSTAASIFKSEYRGGGIDETCKLLMKVLHKTLEAATIDAEKVEMAVLKRTEEGTELEVMSSAFIGDLVQAYKAESTPQ